MSIRITGYDKESITISGLDRKTINLLHGVVSGAQWFRVQEGAAQFHSCFEPLPDPVKDEAMLPFWGPCLQNERQLELFELRFEELRPDCTYYPHITISGLCGYNFSKENYARESAKLLSYGFFQMRSQRSDEGRFWEFWYLPGILATKGDLKDVVDTITLKTRTWDDPDGRCKEKECLGAVLEFLRRNVQFGSLDVSVQRMAMVAD